MGYVWFAVVMGYDLFNLMVESSLFLFHSQSLDYSYILWFGLVK